jgi:uncharacterized protein (DUF302 family)
MVLSSNIIAQTQQSIQVYTTDNSSAKIDKKSIEKAFKASGLVIDGINDMNIPFSLRFKNTHYKLYNLGMFRNNELTIKLLKKYPNFGALTPLSMSIWSNDNNINISTLSINGISRAAKIPLNDPDLIAYANMIDKALKAALPNGKYKKLDLKDEDANSNYAVNIEMHVEIDEDSSIEEFREDFESELEGELEPIGFLLPNYINVQEDLFEDSGYDEYDFYITYSICKFDVIYPVSKLHPEAGAYAPCAFFAYKKRGEDIMHLGYLGVDNWIKTLNIKDSESTKPLYQAQEMINSILKEMAE